VPLWINVLSRQTLIFLLHLLRSGFGPLQPRQSFAIVSPIGGLTTALVLRGRCGS
jgi:hypothetical protein